MLALKRSCAAKGRPDISMRCKPICRLILAGGIIVFGHICNAEDGSTEVYQLLHSKAVSFDSNLVQNVSVQAMLKATDPRAAFLDADTPEKVSVEPIELVGEWKENICYLKLRELNEGAGKGVIKQVREWGQKASVGTLIDLRGAGGSDLESVDMVASWFAKEGRLLYRIKDSRGRVISEHKTLGGVDRLNAPLVLLIDKNTHDAAELLAATLKNRSGVMLIGAPTRGDQRLRETIRLKTGKRVYLATQLIELVEGEPYSDAGVRPDAIVTPIAQPNNPTVEGDRDAADDVKQQLDRLNVADAVFRRATDMLLGLKALESISEPD